MSAKPDSGLGLTSVHRNNQPQILPGDIFYHVDEIYQQSHQHISQNYRCYK